jgi:hypothetical protein
MREYGIERAVRDARLGAPVTAPLRWFFRVAAVLAVIAGVELFIGAADTDRFFSWTIDPPLTAAFLGAAYWAAAVLLGWAAAQRDWAFARTAIPPVLTIAVLLLVATLAHLDKFHFDAVFGWFWLVVYIVVSPLLIYLLWRQPGDESPPGPPIGALARAVLALQALVMVGLGAALVIAPTDVASAWPWPLTPLTGRAIGAFLCGFGVAAAFALRENDLARLRGSAMSYAALGALEVLALALHWDDADVGSAAGVAYCVGVASVLAVGLYGATASSASSASR